MKSSNEKFKAIELPTEKRHYLNTGNAFYWQILQKLGEEYNYPVGDYEPKRKLFTVDGMLPITIDELKELAELLEKLE